ncbi:MAG TPA: hypothetical protein VJP58_08035 [Candidatus Nitrosocosmicus sp.]|nr:hypothetical protein [Candidatus Nitrosocosmicus sp.]
MKWRFDKINKVLNNSYSKYYSTLTFNRNLLISGILGFVVSLFVAQISAKYSDDIVLNSTLTVIFGYLTYKTIFAILFHLNNKQRYTDNLTGRINFQEFKKILIKMLFASSVFDIVNNVTSFILMIQLLELEYSPIESTTISSIIASVTSYAVINMIVRFIHAFDSKQQ